MWYGKYEIADELRGRGVNSQSGRANHLFCKFFAENYMKMK